MFNFEKMDFQRLIVNYMFGKLSDEQIQYLFKEFISVLTRTRDSTTVPIDAQRRIVSTIRNLEKSPNSSSKDEEDLTLSTIFKELVPHIDCIQFDSQDVESSMHLRIETIKICPIVRVRLSLINPKKYYDISLTKMTYWILVCDLRSFPMLAQHIQLEKCDNCNFFCKDNFCSLNDIVKHVKTNGIHCNCWQKFAERYPNRPIHYSMKDCRTRCDFCKKYEMMQLTDLIRVLNDSLKNGSLQLDIYHCLFPYVRQILEGTGFMVEFVQRLLSHQQALGESLFQRLFKLIAKLEKFMKENQCGANPDFLSTLDLLSLTGTEYNDYMDELRLGQEQFKERIPKLGFYFCPEILAKEHREARKKEQEEAQEKQEASGRRSSVYC